MSKAHEAQLTWPRYVWLNGSLIEWGSAKVHVFVHGLHYGTGVFEGIRGYYDSGVMKVFRLEDHIVRLFRSAKMIYMEIPYTREDLIKATKELIRVNGFKSDVYIRPIAFRGLGSFGLRARNPIEVAIIALEFGKYLKPDGIKCMVSSWRKPAGDSLLVEAKATANYLLYHLASLEAALHGFDEAILLDAEGYVSEGSGENIFIVKNGKLITPPVYNSILEGITRDTVIRFSRELLGMEVIERRIRKAELYIADEVFLTGTAAEIVPVIEIDGRVIGNGKPGEVTRRIQDTYRQVVLGRIERYRSWITEIVIE